MNIEEIFGVRVFDDAAMKKRLPKKAYESLSRTRRLGEALDPEIADVVACAKTLELHSTYFLEGGDICAAL